MLFAMIEESDGIEIAGLAAGDETRMAVLALLRHGPASRASIARELDLSPATVSQITKRLLAQGVIERRELAPSDGGRPGQLLGLVGGVAHAVGVKLTADHLVLVDVGLDGALIGSRAARYNALTPDAIPRLLVEVESFIAQGAGKLLGIGIGVPGVVARPDEGEVDAPVLGWDNLPVGAYLRKALDVPVLVENDVKALAIAERLYGRGRDHASFIVVTVGRGVGFAYFADGVLARGAHGGAGELGHVIVVPDGARCACGRRGCLEAYIGAQGLVAAARRDGLLSGREGPAKLKQRADAGDERALAVYAHAGRLLAEAVAGPVAAIDPEAVFVAGEGTDAWEHWDSAFRDTLSGLLPAGTSQIAVEVDAWDESNWAHGAAAIVLATPFDPNAVAGKQRFAVLARLHGSDALTALIQGRF